MNIIGHKMRTKETRLFALYVIFKLIGNWLTIVLFFNLIYFAYSETIRQIKLSRSSPEKIELLKDKCNSKLIIDEYKLNSCSLNKIDKNKVNMLLRQSKKGVKVKTTS